MKITINKEMKIKLLKAMRDGYLETDSIPELKLITPTIDIHVYNSGIPIAHSEDEIVD